MSKKEFNNKGTEGLMPSEIFSIGTDNVTAEMMAVESSAEIFDEDAEEIQSVSIQGNHHWRYIPFGSDNQLPFEIIRLIGIDEVMSQNKLFNVLTCFGTGPKYMVLKEQIAYMYAEEFTGIVIDAISSADTGKSTSMRSYLWGHHRRRH